MRLKLDNSKFLALIVSLGVFTIFVLTLAPSIAWDNCGSDGGELTLAAVFLGVPHPTGYPVFVLLGKIFSFLPFGDYAYRTNLLSAFFGALTAFFLVLIFSELNLIMELNQPKWLAAICGFLIPLGKTFWSQAVITEVYVINAGICCGVFLTFLLAVRPQDELKRKKKLFYGALFWAIAMGMHLTSALLLFGVLYICYLTHSKFWTQRFFWYGLLGNIGIVMCLYSLLPIFALQNPPVNWTFIKTPEALWEHITAKSYHFYFDNMTIENVFSRIQIEFLPRLMNEWSKAGVFLIFCGILFIVRHLFWPPNANIRIFFANGILIWNLFFFPAFLFACYYGISDIIGYFILPILQISVFIFFGFGFVFNIFRKISIKFANVFTLGLFVMIFSNLMADLSEIDLSQRNYPLQYAEFILSKIPENSVIFSEYDSKINSFLYQKWLGKNRRPDVVIIVRTLLNTSWYINYLKEAYPSLKIPNPPTAYKGNGKKLSGKELREAINNFCNKYMKKIVLANSDKPLFTIVDHEPTLGEYYTEMFFSIFRLHKTPPAPPKEVFGDQWIPLDFSSIANADYRENPFLINDDVFKPVFSTFGRGLLPGKVPFWLVPPKITTGKNSVIGINFNASFSVEIPLVPVFSKNVHIALLGYGTNLQFSTFPQARVIYDNGEGSWEDFFPATDFKIHKGTVLLDMFSFSLQPERMPKALQIRYSPPSSSTVDLGKVGICIFAATQEKVHQPH